VVSTVDRSAPWFLSYQQTAAVLQVYVASTLGVPMHKLVSKTKRIGGGFGGKETRSIFIHCAVAVPVYHLRRPVKVILDRDEDMQMTGTCLGVSLKT
jgi:xanthine dehydrogenase/oxidase